MDNLKIWDNLKQPPQEALKPIAGGRLKGKTDISPQWRYKAMTEQFGVCGVGWKYTVERLWLEPVGDEVCAFAEVNLSIIIDNEWSAPIPGVGGSMLIAQESSGLHVSDEAYKMAITDALSVSMKMIGVAANIYAGLSDGKYSEKEDWENLGRKTQRQPGSAPPLKNIGELYARAKKFGLSSRDVAQACGVGSGNEINDFDEAWKKVASKFQAKIKQVREQV